MTNSYYAYDGKDGSKIKEVQMNDPEYKYTKEEFMNLIDVAAIAAADKAYQKGLRVGVNVGYLIGAAVCAFGIWFFFGGTT